MSSQIWEDSQIWQDSQQIPETQLDNVIGVPDSPDEKIVLEGVRVKAEEEQQTKDSTSTTPTARQALPILVQERHGQRKADSWTDAPRKYRGVMHHTCKPAA